MHCVQLQDFTNPQEMYGMQQQLVSGTKYINLVQLVKFLL